MTHFRPDDEDDSDRQDWVPGFYAGPGPSRPPMESWPDAPATRGRTRATAGRPLAITGGSRRRRPGLLTGALIAGGVAVAAVVSFKVIGATPASSSGPAPTQSASSSSPASSVGQSSAGPASTSASAKPSSDPSAAGPLATQSTASPRPTRGTPSPSRSTPSPRPKPSHSPTDN